jgi:hypothetical protein
MAQELRNFQVRMFCLPVCYKNIKIRTYRTIILPVVLCVVKLGRREQGEICGLDPSGLGRAPVADSCEQGTESFDSIKDGEFLQRRTKCPVLKKVSLFSGVL